MKKICFVTTIAASLRTFLLKQAEALHNTGEYEVYFISNPDPQIEKEFPKYVKFYPIQMKRGVGIDGLYVIPKLVRIFRKERFDIVQYFTPNASFYASTAARIAGIPCRIYSQWGILYVGFKGIKRKTFKYIEKRVCRNSTVIEVENRANLEFSHKERLYPDDKGYVIWNGSASGVSLDKYDIEKKDEWRSTIRNMQDIDDNQFVFGFTGRVTRDKGVNELLKAFDSLQKKCPNAILMIVGATSDVNTRSLNHDLFEKAKANNKIRFVGRKSDPERYYAAMDCYVMPSYREGFGMTIIEAESMELPVLVSDITGHKDTMVPHVTGYCFDAYDDIELARLMEKMYFDRQLCFKMGKAARKYVVENYDQEILMEKIVECRQNVTIK